mgnify:CR=1 FL=1
MRCGCAGNERDVVVQGHASRTVAMGASAAAIITMNRTLDFFSTQFEDQIKAAAYALKPFEQRVLPLLHGDVLDLGCGLGNLAWAAAQRGARVDALDGCANAVADLHGRAVPAGLALTAAQADLHHWRPTRRYDCVVSIGLLMFFPCATAERLLVAAQDAVRPGGLCAINVLIEGTTYLDMFEPGSSYLFAEGQVLSAFSSWCVAARWIDEFAAPGGTSKRFETVIARR